MGGRGCPAYGRSALSAGIREDACQCRSPTIPSRLLNPPQYDRLQLQGSEPEGSCHSCRPRRCRGWRPREPADGWQGQVRGVRRRRPGPFRHWERFTTLVACQITLNVPRGPPRRWSSWRVLGTGRGRRTVCGQNFRDVQPNSEDDGVPYPSSKLLLTQEVRVAGGLGATYRGSVHAAVQVLAGYTEWAHGHPDSNVISDCLAPLRECAHCCAPLPCRSHACSFWAAIS